MVKATKRKKNIFDYEADWVPPKEDSQQATTKHNTTSTLNSHNGKHAEDVAQINYTNHLMARTTAHATSKTTQSSLTKPTRRNPDRYASISLEIIRETQKT